MSTIPSNSSQKRVEGESPDSIGDFTAAMFSQLDLGFSPGEDRGSLGNTITKGAITSTITKPAATSSADFSSQTTPASGPATSIVNLVGQTESTPMRPIPSGASPASPPTSVSESTTSSRRLFGRSRSSTLTASVSTRPAQPSSDQPQPQTISRSQPLKPVKSTISHVPGPRKIAQDSLYSTFSRWFSSPNITLHPRGVVFWGRSVHQPPQEYPGCSPPSLFASTTCHE